MLFYVELLPDVGEFLVGLRYVITRALTCLLMFVSAFMSFVLFFYYYLQETKPSSNFIDKFYITFELFLNVYNTPKSCTTTFIWLHIPFVFIVSIFLINYLIAVFSLHFSIFWDNRKTIILLTKLDRYLTVRNRVHTPLKWANNSLVRFRIFRKPKFSFKVVKF